MWCITCQRDLPAVSEPGFNGVRCTQCGNVVASSATVTATQSVEPLPRLPRTQQAPSLEASESTGEKPVFIEVEDPVQSTLRDGLIDCDQINTKLWRVDSAHKTINKNPTSKLVENSSSENVNRRKIGKGKKGVNNTGLAAELSFAKPRSHSLILSVRFAILVVLIGSCFSLWSMAAGHYAGWLSGQLFTFVGIGWGLAVIGQKTNQLIQSVNMLEQKIRKLK